MYYKPQTFCSDKFDSAGAALRTSKKRERTGNIFISYYTPDELDRRWDLWNDGTEVQGVVWELEVPCHGNTNAIRGMWRLLALLALPLAGGDVFTLGYLTGSQRSPGDMEYVRPGLSISGAISLAVEELNEGLMGSRGHRLEFKVAETRGDELVSIALTAELWTQNVSAYIGPQETCVTEARMAAAFNLPMISYFCMDYETSDKNRFPTFARTRPPDTQISKSVVSVLLNFNWTQVAFFYLNSTDSEFRKIGSTILLALQAAGITVRFTRCWSTPYFHVQGYKDNPFLQLVRETYEDTRRTR